jgi:hypothetical protein
VHGLSRLVGSDLRTCHRFWLDYDQTVLGLQQLARYGLRVEIRVVLHALTIPRLPELAEYIYRNLTFAEHVALMGLENIGYAPRNMDKLWIDPADYQDQRTNWNRQSRFCLRGGCTFRFITTSYVFFENRFGSLHANRFPIGRTYTWMNAASAAFAINAVAFSSGPQSCIVLIFTRCLRLANPRLAWRFVIVAISKVLMAVMFQNHFDRKLVRFP